jgi:hypothetical protein
MRRVALWAFLGYSAITLALTYPLVLHLVDGVPNDLGDPLLNTWILWWNSQAVPFTADWWNAPAFFPATDALALSEHLFGLSVLTTPVIWLTGNPQLAYNLAFLGTFVLSAMGGYALGVTLTGRRDAGFVAGLVYGFAPYRMAQFAHIQVLASFWMPFALVGLHKYLQDRRVRWLALFGTASLGQGLTNGYFLLFFPLLVGLWLLWFPPKGQRLRTMVTVVATYAVASLPLVPVLLHYRTVHGHLGLSRDLGEMAYFSADVTDLWHAFYQLSFWSRWLPAPGPEAELFPGLTVVVLILAGVVWGQRTTLPTPVSSRPLLPRSLRLALVAIAGVLSLVAASVVVLGPWKVEVFGLAISAQKLARPVTQALGVWLIVALTGPGVRRLAAARSALTFYVGATVIMWILCLGPDPRFAGTEIPYVAPYQWLTLLPGFDGLRVPARFTMIATLCLAGAASAAVVRLHPRLTRRGQSLLLAAVFAGVLVDGWRLTPVLQPPSRSIVTEHDEVGAVFEVPFGSGRWDVAAMYRGMVHGHPVVNGYSGHDPPYVAVLRDLTDRRDPDALVALASRGLRHVVVMVGEDAGREWRDYVASCPGAMLVGTSADQWHYVLASPAATGATGQIGPPLPVALIEASVAAEQVPALIDGDLTTRWSTGAPQRGGEMLSIDLGIIRRVSGTQIALGEFRHDAPRRLVVEGSLDGERWTELWEGGRGALTLLAAIDVPVRLPLRVEFPPAEARYVRLRQTGSDPVFYWSVAELAVLAARPVAASVDR